MANVNAGRSVQDIALLSADELLVLEALLSALVLQPLLSAVEEAQEAEVGVELAS